MLCWQTWMGTKAQPSATFYCLTLCFNHFLAGVNFVTFKFISGNIKAIYEICSELTKKTPEQHHWGCHCTRNEVSRYRFLQLKWPNWQFSADLVTFTEEIFNEKSFFVHFVLLYLLLPLNRFQSLFLCFN